MLHRFHRSFGRQLWFVSLLLLLLLLAGSFSLYSPDTSVSAAPPAGSITIIKDADPPDGTDFDFLGDLGAFALDDAVPNDFDAVQSSITFNGLAAGDYDIIEVVPSSWKLDEVKCAGGDYSNIVNGVTIHLKFGDNVTCTFSNAFTSAGGQIDLLAGNLEVTQAVQNIQNNVRLVANKPTYVRFHVSSVKGDHYTYAQLTVTKVGGKTTVLSPLNPNYYIYVRETPDRAILDHTFLFEIPDDFLQGQIALNAEVNPDLPWRPRNPVEVDYSNNTTSIDGIVFEAVPDLNLVVYRVGYFDSNNNVILPPVSHVDQMVGWLERAFPTPHVKYEMRTYPNTVWLAPPLFNCGWLNGKLFSKKLFDFLSGAQPFGTRYYGMVDDSGGFMRGCAHSPGFAASGPTGTGTFGWDFDGSYGDWYGGHELAHTYGRGHANFCGAKGGPAYPYPNGQISPTLSGNKAMYGFDISTWEVYPPFWKDVMTYCSNQWIGDFTYEALMDVFQNTPVMQRTADRRTVGQTDRLAVVGFINPATRNVRLEPLMVIPDAGDVEPRTPGPFAIVLRAKNGDEVARYPFTPDKLEGGPAQDRSFTGWMITELVPYVAGTVRVEIRGPQDGLLHAVDAGVEKPQVTLQSPNGGETLAGDTATVSWSASDSDGDDLRFHVQYSADDGATWELVAQDVEETSVDIPAENFRGTANGRFRVLASDGIHTSRDDSDDTFTVPNREPLVQIRKPNQAITVVTGETVALRGRGYDLDSGRMPDEQLTWSSDRDGELGEGAQFSISDLSVGTHTITLTADDGDGGVNTADVTVTVVENPTEAPPAPDALVVGPSQLVFEPGVGQSSAVVYIQNQTDTPITWEVSSDQPWVQVSRTSGSTPDSITVAFQDPGDLAEGSHEATLTFTSPDVPEESATLPVTVQLVSYEIYLPAIIR